MADLKMTTRRSLLASCALAPFAVACKPRETPRSERELHLLKAPSNLGLSPLRPGHIPGTWRAPEVLDRAGLSARLAPARRVELERPPYDLREQPGTRIRNGVVLRAFSLELAREVERSLRDGAMPVVIGGDCSVFLGCLLGLRRTGGRGLVHVDGHCDFFHPGNFDFNAHLGAASGMDLALATGRGDAMLTAWPDVAGPLVEDADVIQIGERNANDPQFSYPDIKKTAIELITVESAKTAGMAAIARRTSERLEKRGLTRVWLHVDLDVLDKEVMPAVDAPGSPGLTYRELTELIGPMLRTGRVAGVNFAIYDPDLDPEGRFARNIVDCIVDAMIAG